MVNVTWLLLKSVVILFEKTHKKDYKLHSKCVKCRNHGKFIAENDSIQDSHKKEKYA